MKNRTIHGNYFYGNEISTYGKENGYVDYATLAKSFNAILNNNIFEVINENFVDCWEQVNGYIDNSDEIEEIEEQIEQLENELELIEEYNERGTDSDKYKEIEEQIEQLKSDIEELEDEENYCNHEIFQYYIIDSWGAEILENWTDEIVFYNEQLDMYIWGVTHWGTSWDYVLTDIKIGDIEE